MPSHLAFPFCLTANCQIPTRISLVGTYIGKLKHQDERFSGVSDFRESDMKGKVPLFSYYVFVLRYSSFCVVRMRKKLCESFLLVTRRLLLPSESLFVRQNADVCVDGSLRLGSVRILVQRIRKWNDNFYAWLFCGGRQGREVIRKVGVIGAFLCQYEKFGDAEFFRGLRFFSSLSIICATTNTILCIRDGRDINRKYLIRWMTDTGDSLSLYKIVFLFRFPQSSTFIGS